MQQPSVVIILSNYNGLSTLYNKKPILKISLNSVKKTKYGNLKVILADDASTDESVVYAKRLYPNIITVKNRVNGGFSKNNNNAIRFALDKYNPDYILLLNNDIIIEDKNWLTKMVELAESDEKIGIVACKLLYPNGRIQHGGIVMGAMPHSRGRGEPDSAKYSGIEELEAVAFACTLIKKELIRKIGLLDDAFFMGYEDEDYCVRARKAGFKVMYHGGVSLIHLEGLTSTYAKTEDVRMRMFFNERKNYLYFVRKHSGDYSIFGKAIIFFAFFGASFISIEGSDRKRGISSLRLKPMALTRFWLSLKAFAGSRSYRKP